MSLHENIREPRNTFGLTDKETGQRYEDIISAHLELRRIDIEELAKDNSKISESSDRGKDYQILLDYKALKKLRQEKEIAVLISFQVRKDGNFAVARLFNERTEENHEVQN